MASSPTEPLYEILGQGPPPEKDLFQLVVSENKVIWRSWIISLSVGRRGAPPTEEKVSHHDFLQDKRLQQEITTVFGEQILDNAMMICHGTFPESGKTS